MEKKKTAGSFKAFLKKNVYYIIMGVCLLAIAAMVTVTLINRNKPSDPGNPSDVIDPSDPTDPTDPTGPTDPVDPTDPKPLPIVFVLPVESAVIGNDYCMDGPVWYATLRHYAVHGGIDFMGEDGDTVFSVYSGTITDVSYDELKGYSITVQHNSTLKSVYSSLNEPTVTVGQTVTKGQAIGTMGNTMGKEYLEGVHLHLEVFENGEIISPYTYMPYESDK